ncbi:SDR family oxidoreductase [Caballeronia novacaledonica]|uniref:SDR family oxidoreductase n=1 Tax=Caballeronia novacaledonica TaxID=1544861 RepID=A0AA37MT85_9BURK|nr:SDR family oxidoreductase [Caballeronia novacaledonica]GJH27387.1 SDR family oxidoreductase [Caballeronia novacaledonica]
MKLKNKIALVTGGTSGIGLEAARLFQSEGATVVVTGTNVERLANAASVLGEGAMTLSVDLRDSAQIDKAIADVVETFGRIDVIFANAGAGTAAPLEAVTPEQISDQFALNFNGVFFTIQKAAPHLSKGSSIVITTSFLNEVGTPGLSILSATKAATRSLVRSIGAELAPRGIRVNAVSPGPIATPFHEKLGLSQKQLADTGSAIQAAVPLKRFGEAREIATAALFLASDDSAFMTGSELVVDGGLTQL